MAGVSCQQCQTWMIDVDPQSPKFGQKLTRGGQDMPRRGPTPCHVCPKGSPDNDHDLTEENWQTVVLYLRSRATNGRHLNEAEAADPLLARNFALIDLAIRQQERQESAAALVNLMPPAK